MPDQISMPTALLRHYLQSVPLAAQYNCKNGHAHRHTHQQKDDKKAANKLYTHAATFTKDFKV